MVALLREFPDVEDDLQSGAVAACPARGIRRRRGAGSRPRARSQPPTPSRRPTSTSSSKLLSRPAAADDRHLSAIRRTAGPPRRIDAHAAARRRAARQFSVDDLRDLQVWHKLAWVDPSYSTRTNACARWSEGEPVQRRRQGRAARRRTGAAEPGHPRVSRGRRARPNRDFDLAVLPPNPAAALRQRRVPANPSAIADAPERFLHPEDAALQLERASDCHLRLFGRRPTGLWPSEGSVSDAMVPLAAAAGFEWMATDELILARSLDMTAAEARARRPVCEQHQGGDGARHADSPPGGSVVTLTALWAGACETHPGHRPIETSVPDALFDARN